MKEIQDLSGKDWDVTPLEAYARALALRRNKGRALRPSSFNIYFGMFRRLLAFLDERGTPLNQLSRADLEAFFEFKQVAPETRQRYLHVFRDVCQYLRQQDLIAANPAQTLLLSQLAPERDPIEVLTPEEVDRLVADLPRDRDWLSLRNRALVLTLLGSGLKPAELRDLTLDRVMIPPGQPGSLTVAARRPRPSRDVPVSPLQSQALRDWLELRAAAGTPGAHAFVTTPQGLPLSFPTLFRAVRQACERAGISHRYTSAMLLRNTAGACWLANHALPQAQAWLGHERDRTTALLAPHAVAWAGRTLP